MLVLALLISGCGKKPSSSETKAPETTPVTTEGSGNTSEETASAETEAPETGTEEINGLITETTLETAGLPVESNVPMGQSDVYDEPETEGLTVDEDGEYTSKEEVALYIHTYGHLPSNYITKSEAQKLGWDKSNGSLWRVTDHKSIGGDKFGNYEGLLPKASGRQYYECDIDYDGVSRNAKRIIYSNDGLIYYTEDHYKTFELLYGEELL